MEIWTVIMCDQKWLRIQGVRINQELAGYYKLYWHLNIKDIRYGYTVKRRLIEL